MTSASDFVTQIEEYGENAKMATSQFHVADEPIVRKSERAQPCFLAERG
jgi:hypothetical protein